MTKEQLIQYLRTNLFISPKSEGEENSTLMEATEYLELSDEEIESVLTVSLSRNYPDYRSLDNLPNNIVYPLILLSKKEIFTSLAVKYATWYNLSAEGGNTLSREAVFNHFMELAKQAENEYEQYLEDGAENNTLTSYDVTLANRYYTRRNYEKGAIPAPYLYIDTVGTDYVECSWKVNLNAFKQYDLYISEEPIFDIYKDKYNKVDKDSALSSLTIKDSRQTMCRFSNLTLGTTYYITLACHEMNGLVGYTVEEFTTIESE